MSPARFFHYSFVADRNSAVARQPVKLGGIVNKNAYG
jgi:hypothetical protein